MFFRHFCSVMLLSAVVLGASPRLSAQNLTAGPPSTMENEKVKAELFGGYTQYHVGGTVDGVTVPNLTNGRAFQFMLETTSRIALVVDISSYSNKTDSASNYAAGPQFRFHIGRFTPFFEGMLGIQSFSPKPFPNQKTATYMVGAGGDFKLSRRISIRPIQADFINTYYSAISATGKTNPFNGYRVQSGVVFNLFPPPLEGYVSADCMSDPGTVDAGAEVKINVTPKGFLSKRTLRYQYVSTGAKVAGSTATASVDTTGAQPGDYTVTAKVADNGKGKHQQAASCMATFTVKARPASAPTVASAEKPSVVEDKPSVVEQAPPTLSVSGLPQSLHPGDAATITASASSPDSHPLTYSCTSTAGKLTGEGPTYKLETAGVADSTITVNCTVSDDRNVTTSTTATVKLLPPLQAMKFGTIAFQHDAKRPTRVDNEAKGELDRYADALAASPDAKGVVVGYATARERGVRKNGKRAPNFAARRAVNTKDYLNKDKGIDPARIEPRAAHGQKITDLWIVPAGASLQEAGTKAVDENKVKAVPRIALKPKQPAPKKSGA